MWSMVSLNIIITDLFAEIFEVVEDLFIEGTIAAVYFLVRNARLIEDGQGSVIGKSLVPKKDIGKSLQRYQIFYL